MQEAVNEANRVLSRIQSSIEALKSKSFSWEFSKEIEGVAESIKEDVARHQRSVMASITTGMENLEHHGFESQINYLNVIYRTLEYEHLKDKSWRAESTFLPFQPILDSVQKLLDNLQSTLSLAHKFRNRETVSGSLSETIDPSTETDEDIEAWSNALEEYLESRTGGIEQTWVTLDAIATIVLDEEVEVMNARRDLYVRVDYMVEWYMDKEYLDDGKKKRQDRVRKNLSGWLKVADIPLPDSPNGWRKLAYAIRKVIKPGNWSGFSK